MTNDELDELMIKAGLRFGYPFFQVSLGKFFKASRFKRAGAGLSSSGQRICDRACAFGYPSDEVNDGSIYRLSV